MATIQRLVVAGFEEVVRCDDPSTGLRAYVAIHSTRLGPALGGTRFRPYASDDDALADVLRLARGMTYKAAVSGLELGGGKAVILGEPARDRSDELLTAYAQVVDSLGGRYVTAEDVGTTQADMDHLRGVTPHVTGVSEEIGGSGDPSPATAHGVRHAMRAVARHRLGVGSLQGLHVVVSGVGKVGSALVALLVADGAEVSVADIDDAAVRRVATTHGVATVAAGDAHREACDIFSPCALGAVLGPTTIPELRCAAVVGAANNQLVGPGDDARLRRAGVLYAPDYVVNAGGVINIAEELHPRGYDRGRALGEVARIATTTAAVLHEAEAADVSTVEAADRIVERRLAGVGSGDASGTIDERGGGPR